MAEATNRARARWVLPPWAPLPKPDGVVCSRQVAGVILPTRCVLVAQRMRDEGEGELREWARALRASGFTREDMDAHLEGIMATPEDLDWAIPLDNSDNYGEPYLLFPLPKDPDE